MKKKSGRRKWGRKIRIRITKKTGRIKEYLRGRQKKVGERCGRVKRRRVKIVQGSSVKRRKVVQMVKKIETIEPDEKNRENWRYKKKSRRKDKKG